MKLTSTIPGIPGTTKYRYAQDPRTGIVPFLTKPEAFFLARAPYDYPTRAITRNEQAIAVRLTRQGLLERAPGRAAIYRCTEYGTEVVQRYRTAKWLER